MSGLQIFNAYPNLHWGSKAEPEEAFFSIIAANEEGEIKGYLQFYGRSVETTGILGVQSTERGPSPRAFPSWLTIPGYFWLAGGRRWHFFFAWVFVLNGLIYLAYNIARGHLRRLLFTPKDLIRVPLMALHYLRLRRESPQGEEYNPLQKLSYTGVVFLLTPLVILSGLAMSPQMDVAFNWLPAMFGGRQAARTFHFLATFLFLLFTFGHVLMVLAKGPINNMRSIITGWYAQKIPVHSEASPSKAVVENAKDDERKLTETENRITGTDGTQVKEGIKNEES
jgi:thiosulfate reductase cytochrome b subunit